MERDHSDIKFSAELARKALHLLVLVIPITMWHVGRELSIYLLLPAVVLAIGGDVLRWRSARFEALVSRWVGFMMRPSERPEQSRPTLNGATSILCGSLLAVVFFDARAAAAAIAIFVVGDAAAALFGRRFGKRSIFGGKATVAGSSAFALAGFMVALVIPGLPWIAGAGSALVSGLFEALPKGQLNDNIVVPVAATGCLAGLLHILSVSL